MIPTDDQIALVIAGSPALTLIAKATVVSAAALVAARLARRRPASIRHLMAATSLVVLAALPLASAVVPARQVTMPFLVEPAANIAAMTHPASVPGVSGRTAVVSQLADSSPAVEAIPRRTLPTLWTVLLIAWVSGAVIFIVPMMVGLARVQRVRRHGRPWRDGQPLVASIASALGVRRPIQVLLDDAADGPITCGVVRPAIIFPPDVRQWPMGDLRRAVVHEIEHVRRADWLTLCLARSVCAVYWFHPLVWVLWRQLRVDAERACDDAVLRTADAETYADQLVTLAERLVSNRAQSALAMANRHDLSARISAVLDYRQQRGRAGSLRIAGAIAVAALAIAAIAPLRAVGIAHNLAKRTPGEPVPSPVPSPAAARVEVASIKPAAAPKSNHEVSDMPVYVLTTLSNRGELGPNLRRAVKDCLPREACEGFFSLRTEYQGAQWPMVLRTIASRLDHRLIDRTGLSGAFDFELAYGFGLVPNADNRRPDVFTAVREQLGLRLELSRVSLVQARTPPVAFDVASIKPTPANPPITTIGNALPGGRWSPRNVTALTILTRAFPEHSLPGMIVGGPGWISERRFDIDARTDRTVTPAQYPDMIRQLLTDRFKLKTHTEARPVDVYSLVLARTDGRLGPRLRPASAECTRELEAARESARASRMGPISSPRPEQKPCGVRVSMPNGMMRIAGGRSLMELAAEIQSWTDLKVVDRTGLRGDYEAELEFDYKATVSAANADPGRPSLFTAVQEQLGLRLQRSRETVDVLVIDAIEMPSEN